MMHQPKDVVSLSLCTYNICFLLLCIALALQWTGSLQGMDHIIWIVCSPNESPVLTVLIIANAKQS